MESNFASAVIYAGRGAGACTPDARRLAEGLAGLFSTYEVIVADDGCGPDELEQLTGALAGHPYTIVRMGCAQGLERAMNAGIDAAVGDYVYEVDDLAAFDPAFIRSAYDEVMAGSDVVNGVFSAGPALGSALFYKVFNQFSGYPSHLSSNPVRLVSRRAINRVRSMSDYMPYRKASYAASGLGVVEVEVAGRPRRSTNIGMAATSLALYTSAFYKVACWLAVLMAALSLAEVAYVVVIAASGIAVAGWVTTMLVLTGGLFAIFALFAFVLKYLDLLVSITFERQGYLTDGIERPDGNGSA